MKTGEEVRGSEHHHRRHVHTEDKIQAVLRVLKGEAGELVADDLGVPIDRLERWEARFVEGGRVAMENHSRRRSGTSSLPKSFWQWVVLIVVLILTVLALVNFLNRDAGQ